MGLYKPWKKRANLSVNCRPDWNSSDRISLTIYYVFRWPYIMNVWYTLFITRFSYDILFFHIIYFVQQNIFCELSHNILCILIYIMCFTIYNVSYHIPYRWKISRTKVTKTSLSDEIFNRRKFLADEISVRRIYLTDECFWLTNTFDRRIFLADEYAY